MHVRVVGRNCRCAAVPMKVIVRERQCTYMFVAMCVHLLVDAHVRWYVRGGARCDTSRFTICMMVGAVQVQDKGWRYKRSKSTSAK